MKTSIVPAPPPGRSGRPAWLMLAALISTTVATADPQAGAVEPKTHILFMGADVLVEQGKQAYRVEDVVGGSLVIKVDDKEVRVPANWGKINMKVDRSLKLTTTSVTVDHLKVERAYTPGNDPVRKFMKQQGEIMAAEDTVASKASVNATAQAESNAEGHASKGGTAGLPTLYGDPMLTERQFNAAAAASQSASGRDISFQGNMQAELRQELFDAIDVEFDISSGKPIAKPYVVIMAQFHAHDSKPGESLNWLYAAALNPFESKSQKIRIRKGGFPPGYELEKYQVHVYDGGQEIATSVAEKQVPLTRAEAFAYLLLNYFGSHKGATLPAAPALGQPGPEVKSKLSAGQLKQTYYVKVSKDGLPVAAFADAQLATPVDDTIAPVIGDVRFYPALENGRPAEGVAELRFSRLTL